MIKSISQELIKKHADEFFDKGLRRAIEISKSKLHGQNNSIVQSIIEALEMEIKDPLSPGRYQIPDNMKD